MDSDTIIVVDREDNQIGVKKRGDITDDDIYRVSALWLENTKGQVLLAQRAFTKKNHPGMWGPAVAGTVEEGETYHSNIKKEMDEEIGLYGVEVKPLAKIYYDYSGKLFCQWYLAVVDWEIEEFTMEEGAVEAIKWIDKEELKYLLKTNPQDYLQSIEPLL